MKRTLAILFSLALFLHGSVVLASKNEALTRLQNAIDRLLATPELKSGFQGIAIVSLKDHKTLYERNADKVFIPASNNKLLTSAFAIEQLGSDFAFETSVHTTGSIHPEGVLQGDLVLVGSGDPTFSMENLRDLAHQVALKGIKSVEGALRLNTKHFDIEPYGEGWAIDDEGASYQTPILGLNLNGNVFDLLVRPGKALGDTVEIETRPVMDARWFHITAQTTKHDKLTLTRDHDTKITTIAGERAIDAKPEGFLVDSLAIPDMPAFVLQQFQSLLKAEGITLQATSPLPPDAPTQKIASVRSATLPTLLEKMNKPSDNLIADCLFLACGVNTARRSWSQSQALSISVFKQLGLDTNALQMKEGCGLSRQNLVSPRNLVRLLTHCANASASTYFYASLPIAGVDGTLKNRMKHTPAENNCRAKTGSLSGVSSLSGYVKTMEGEPLVFSILMNSHLCPSRTARTIQDRIVVLLAEFRRQNPSQSEK